MVFIDLVNGKSYIESSISLYNRFYIYYSLNNLNKSKNSISIINNAIKKYGFFKFSLDILESCKKDEVIKREQWYIDLLKPENNFLKIAGSSFGYKHSEEAKAKIGISHKNRIIS